MVYGHPARFSGSQRRRTRRPWIGWAKPFLYFFNTLRQLVNPTRILLTTRHNLFEQPDIYHYPIGELGEGNALTLVRFEAKQRNLAMLANATDEELHPI